MSNFNNTGEVKEISILDMMNGAIGERGLRADAHHEKLPRPQH